MCKCILGWQGVIYHFLGHCYLGFVFPPSLKNYCFRTIPLNLSSAKQGWHKGIITVLVIYLVVGGGVTFWFQIDNALRDATILFKLFRRVRHHLIQVNFEKSGNQHLTELWLLVGLDFGITVHLWFLINNIWDAKVSFNFYRRVKHHNIQVKFLNLKVICKFLTDLWPFWLRLRLM